MIQFLERFKGFRFAVYHAVLIFNWFRFFIGSVHSAIIEATENYFDDYQYLKDIDKKEYL